MIISSVKVSLESPIENATGRTRIESVISYDKNDYEIRNYQELSNVEFDKTHEVVDFISKTLNISSDIIEII